MFNTKNSDLFNYTLIICKKNLNKQALFLYSQKPGESFMQLAPSPTPLSLPIYDCHISAGFPSPASDWSSITLDLNRYLIHNPAATFFIYASDDSMNASGIFDGYLLIVDRSLPPKHHSIVLASVNNDVITRCLFRKNGKTFLMANNPLFSPTEFIDSMDVSILGVLTYVIHILHR